MRLWKLVVKLTKKLKRTKEGKYVTIAKGSLAHLRGKAQGSQPSYNDEEYYYGIR